MATLGTDVGPAYLLMVPDAASHEGMTQHSPGPFSEPHDGAYPESHPSSYIQHSHQRRWYRERPPHLLEVQHFKFSRRLVILLITLDALMSALILRYVPYTEIDWSTYMEQVQLFQDGERDYYKIQGSTGPLVYPGGFVYVFSILRSLTGGRHEPAQVIFAFIYLAHVGIILAIFQRTTRKDPILLSCVILSKRLHSIFLLRCFNDGIAMTFAFAAVLAAQGNHWVTCCILYSLGVSVKMNVLLMAPALLWLLWELASHRDVLKTAGYLALCASIQLLIGLPFLIQNPTAYIHRAFELTRMFEYQWTVNWKFLPVSVFLSKGWALGLLMGHLITLGLLWKRLWVRNKALQMSPEVYRAYVTFVFFSCNFVGIVFARSLHYQFYSWYFPTIPFLLSHFPVRRPIKLVLLACLEHCWDVFPSTPTSSLLLLFVHIAMLGGIFASPIKDLWRREFLMASPVSEMARSTRD